MKKQNLLKRMPFYVLLTGLFPAISFFAANIKEIQAQATARTFIFSFILIIFVFLVSLLILRKIDKAGLFTTLALLFFSRTGIFLNS